MCPPLLSSRFLSVHAVIVGCLGSSQASLDSAQRRSHYSYEGLISEGTSYCYAKLIDDASCCLDNKFAAGVTKESLSRFGSEWFCGDDCLDTKKGPRGSDLLLIPDGATCESPRVLWVHGGSWESGSPDTNGYDVLASKIASLAGAVVMIHDYPLAPVGDYYSIMEASVAALRWLSTASLGKLRCPVGSAPLVVGGDSSGGGTAMSLILKLKVEGGWSPSGIRRSEPEMLPRGQILAGGVLFSPWTNLVCNTPDYYYNAFAKIVDNSSFGEKPANVYIGDIMFRGHPMVNSGEFIANAATYTGGDKKLLVDPIASPYFATEEELGGGGIPPIYFTVGGSESIKGDSMMLAEKLAFFGSEVHVDVGMGMWHDYPMYSEGCGGPSVLWQAERAINRTASFIQTVAVAHQRAMQLGLLWPPTKSTPTSPYMADVYDLSAGFDDRVFPQVMMKEGFRSSFSTEMLGERVVPLVPIFNKHPLVIIAGVGIVCGSFLTLALQKLGKHITLPTSS
eukprot:TRINITY_DN19590_c0_g1_i1.p1 TRINITY_DN19590_c0_g1~~TRINITY_DN19590_c0_g1_i1.p1  ORF type:complete len:508 (-),score=54.86 TRINITY_DN19590_c0_g1_i1:40-1563(-)